MNFNLLGKAPIHPLLFYSGKVAGYVTWILFLLLLTDFGMVRRVSLGYNDITAYVLAGLGLGLSVMSILNLGFSTRLGLPEEDTNLKTNGLYRVSRNPMYVGFNLMTLGSMVYTLNILVILLGVFSIIVYHLIILGEERFLEERFGSEYLDYMRKVSRYF